MRERNKNSEQDFAAFQMDDIHSTLKALASSFVDIDARKEQRLAQSISLKIQPLDMDFQPDGESFCATTRDISLNGMGIINPEPLRHEYIRISMPDQTTATIIARVCYNRSIGLEHSLYLVGVQFVM